MFELQAALNAVLTPLQHARVMLAAEPYFPGRVTMGWGVGGRGVGQEREIRVVGLDGGGAQVNAIAPCKGACSLQPRNRHLCCACDV